MLNVFLPLKPPRFTGVARRSAVGGCPLKVVLKYRIVLIINIFFVVDGRRLLTQLVCPHRVICETVL